MGEEIYKAKFTADTTELAKAAKDAESKLNKFTSSVDKYSRKLVVFGTAVTGAMVGIIAKTVSAAASVEELQNRIHVTFKQGAPKVKAWAKEFADAVGRSRFAMEGLATQFGVLLSAFGMSQDEVLRTSIALGELTTNWESFMDLPASEVIAKVSSGLAGEAEALRRVGVDVSAVAVKQELLNRGFTKGIEAATQLEKVQARLAIILRGLPDAQGDAERTAGELTNQWRAMQGALKDLTVELGEKFAPLAKDVIGKMTGLLKAARDFAEAQPEVIKQAGETGLTIGGIALGAGVAGVAFVKLKAVIVGLISTTAGWVVGIGAVLVSSVVLGKKLGEWYAKIGQLDEQERQFVKTLGLRGELTKELQDRQDEMLGSTESISEAERTLNELYEDGRLILGDWAKAASLLLEAKKKLLDSSKDAAKASEETERAIDLQIAAEELLIMELRKHESVSRDLRVEEKLLQDAWLLGLKGWKGVAKSVENLTREMYKGGTALARFRSTAQMVGWPSLIKYVKELEGKWKEWATGALALSISKFGELRGHLASIRKGLEDIQEQYTKLSDAQADFAGSVLEMAAQLEPEKIFDPQEVASRFDDIDREIRMTLIPAVRAGSTEAITKINQLLREAADSGKEYARSVADSTLDLAELSQGEYFKLMGETALRADEVAEEVYAGELKKYQDYVNRIGAATDVAAEAAKLELDLDAEGLTADAKTIEEQIGGLEKQLAALKTSMTDLQLEAENKDALAAIAEVVKELGVAKQLAADITIGAGVGAGTPTEDRLSTSRRPRHPGRSESITTNVNAAINIARGGTPSSLAKSVASEIGRMKRRGYPVG